MFVYFAYYDNNKINFKNTLCAFNQLFDRLEVKSTKIYRQSATRITLLLSFEGFL